MKSIAPRWRTLGKLRGATVHGVANASRRIVRARPTGRRLGSLVLAVCALAAIAFGLSRSTLSTGADTFLPADNPALEAVEQKAQDFGGDPVVVLLESKQPRQLFMDTEQLGRLLQLEGKLAGIPNATAVYGPGTVLNQVAASAQEMLVRMSGHRDALRATAEATARKQGQSPAEIKAAGRAAVADFDRRYGSLIIEALPAGLPTLRNPQFVQTVLFDEKTGNVRPQWSFVIPEPNTVALLVRPRAGLDQTENQQLVADVRQQVDDAGLALKDTLISGVPVVTAGLADKVTGELPLIAGLVVLAVALRFLLVPTGLRLRHRLWPLAAAAIGTAATVAAFGLAGRPLSFGVAALLPVLLGVGSSIPLYLSVLRDTRRVIAMSVASAVGFFSLAVSPLPFVRQLGVALGAGVLLTMLAALLFRRRVQASLVDTDELKPDRQRGVAESRRRGPVIRGMLVTLAVAVAGAGWFVLPRLDVQADLKELAAGLPELTDAHEVQQVLGSSGEVSVSLRGGDVTSPEALAWAREAEQVIITEYGNQLRPILSLPGLVEFLGDKPTGDQIDSGIDILPQYLTSAVINRTRDSALMIFGLRLQDLGQQARLLDQVRAALPPAPKGLEVELVGLPVAAAEGYELISDGRYLANLAGIAAAGLALVLLLRRRTDALRAMAAGILATGWSLAGIWLVTGELSPLTVALGSLTTVTGCEFLVLLAGRDVRSHRWLRRSIGVACLTSAVGFCALAVSDLAILRDFGLVLTGTVVLSYVSARLVLFVAPPGHRQFKLSIRTRRARQDTAISTETEVDHDHVMSTRV